MCNTFIDSVALNSIMATCAAVYFHYSLCFLRINLVSVGSYII